MVKERKLFGNNLLCKTSHDNMIDRFDNFFMTDGFRLPLNSNCTSQKPRNPRQSTENSWRKSLLPPSLTGFPPVLSSMDPGR